LSQALTFAWFAFTHFSAAFSSVMCLAPMRAETASWSSFVHFHFFRNLIAGEPLVANFLLKNLLRMYVGYAHAYCFGLPPSFSSSLQPLNRGGSCTGESLYVRFRYWGVYQ